MAFRRRGFRARFRRRRSRWETDTITECDEPCINLYNAMTCLSPLVDAHEVMTMRTPRSILDTTEVSNPSDRAIIVGGIKFQAEYWHDPNETNGPVQCDPDGRNVTLMVKVWEALCLLPLAQGTAGAPAYLPLFTNPNSQGGDLADRVLWKRISMIPIWGIATTNGVSQLEHTIRDMGHGPVAVKTKCRIDDRHGLFMVRNFVSNFFTANTGNPCDFSETPTACSIPLHCESWFKVFYTTRK